MIIAILSQNIIKSLCSLNDNTLLIPDQFSYSYLNANELKRNLSKFIDSCRNEGLTTLEVRNSKCKYCFAEFNAYSFHNPNTGDFLIRYVIGRKSETEFIVEECKNKPIQGDKGLPF